MMCKERIKWIDFARGFAIFLVILGHTGIDRYIFTYIYSYHMALFFILSGLTFNIKKHTTYRKFVVLKFKTLIIPYIIFKLINDVVYFIYSKLGYVSMDIDIVDRIVRIKNQIRTTRFTSVLWFLTCLFVMENLYYIITK